MLFAGFLKEFTQERAGAIVLCFTDANAIDVANFFWVLSLMIERNKEPSSLSISEVIDDIITLSISFNSSSVLT
jgi:hypothetical protein